MSSINKVIIIGRLGKDPEIRTTQDGRKIANMTVATSESWKDRNSGERKEKTEWHRVVIFNEHLVKIAQDYLRKGALVYVEGSLQTRKWERDGKDHYATEVVLQNFGGTLTMLTKDHEDKKQEATANADSDDEAVHNAYKKAESVMTGSLPNDEIPF